MPAARHLPGRDGGLAAATALAVAAAIVAYLPALRNGFVWDDPFVLRQLDAMSSWRDLLVMPPEVPRYYYRPLIFLTYLVDRALGGGAPFWFHLSVVAVHALNSVLVLRLARRLFDGDTAAATAGALLFAVWPTHVESVAWMAGRSDVIACAFLLLAVLLGGRRAAWTAWAASLALFLALLAKESAVAGLLLLPTADWLRHRRLAWARYAPLALAAAAWLALRLGNGGPLAGQPVAADAAALAGDLLRALGYYAVRSVAPLDLAPYLPVVPAATPYALLGLAAPLAAALLLWRGWPASRWPAFFLVAWFAATLAPSLAVVVRASASAPVADRYLYVPSVASCLLLGWGLAAAGRRAGLPPAAHWAIVAALAAGLGALTASWAPTWRDDLTFWSAVVERVPSSALGQRELGSALLVAGRDDEAVRALQQALRLPADDTGRAMTYSQLGLAQRRQGRLDAAIDSFEHALRLAAHPSIHHNLGMTLMASAEAAQRQGRTALVGERVRAARTAFERALAIEAQPAAGAAREHWEPARTHALLGQVLVALGEHAAARRHLETALRLDPTGPVADATRRQLQRLGPPP